MSINLFTLKKFSVICFTILTILVSLNLFIFLYKIQSHYYITHFYFVCVYIIYIIFYR